jgi:hypothetical protein
MKVSKIKRKFNYINWLFKFGMRSKASKIIKKKKKKNVIFLHCVGLYPPKSESLLT